MNILFGIIYALGKVLRTFYLPKTSGLTLLSRRVRTFVFSYRRFQETQKFKKYVKGLIKSGLL